MKNKISLVVLLITTIISFNGMKSSAKSFFGGKETVVIQTSANCGECKARIETALLDMSGVKSANLSLKDKKVTVSYDPAKVTVVQIKTAISKVGYDADDVKADETAYNNLPACCKKGGHE